jgi:hypothetical protein
MTTFLSRSGNSPPVYKGLVKKRQPPTGGPRKTSQDPKPPQKLPQDDTVLVHDCYDQHGGETKLEDCACTRRVPRLDAASLIKHGRADAVIMMRNGQREMKRNSIVLRRDYVARQVLKLKINSRKLLPAILKQGNGLSFKNGVIRSKNGTAIELEMDRTDAEYWNNVLVQLGLGVHADEFLKDADWGMGATPSLTSLENFTMAPITLSNGIDDLDLEIDKARAITILERQEGVRRSRHKVGAAGFVKGTSGGLTYWDGTEGGGERISKDGEVRDTRIKGAPAVYSPGNSRDSDESADSRDSDEQAGEDHVVTGQMHSKPDTLNPGDTRTLPEGADDPDDPKLLDDLDKP